MHHPPGMVNKVFFYRIKKPRTNRGNRGLPALAGGRNESSAYRCAENFVNLPVVELVIPEPECLPGYPQPSIKGLLGSPQINRLLQCRWILHTQSKAYFEMPANYFAILM